MGNFFLLLIFALFMLLGSLLSGLSPLYFKIPIKKSNLLAIFGAGLIIGVALLLIIPEATELIYKYNYFVMIRKNLCLESSLNSCKINDFGSIEKPLGSFFSTHQIVGLFLLI